MAMLDQLLPLLNQNYVIPLIQYAYRKYNSTETSLCKIHNDLVENICYGKLSLLVSLDLSVGFDTVDHKLLIKDLWTQFVVIGDVISNPAHLLYGVPQGSVLGPILYYSIYTSSLSFSLDTHNISYHFYADDAQVYIEMKNIISTKVKVEALLSDVWIWMATCKLKLNDRKTRIIIIQGNKRGNGTEQEFTLNMGESQLC